MLTYRTGAAGVPGVAASMAAHLQTETQVPEIQAALATYYGNSAEAHELGQTAALVREDINPKVADLLGIKAGEALSEEQVTHILTGLRADGQAIPGKQIQAPTKDRTRIAYADFTLSAPKSVSLSILFAPTEAERARLDRAHRKAVDQTMALIAKEIGLARKGRGGSKGFDQGHVAWIQFDHYTARPTHKEPVTENGITTTELVTVKVAGDPQRHTHVIVPNVVATDDARVTSFFQDRIRSRVHEWGAIYQAYLGTELRKLGVEWELDGDQTKSMNQRMGRIKSVPRWADELFSKRSQDGEEAGRAYAAKHGADWDRLTPEQRIKFLKGGTANARRAKTDDLADYQSWLRQAQDGGYEHRSVLRPDEPKPLASRQERLAAAYQTGIEVLDPELQRRSVFEGSLARVSAAKGLIEHGIESPEDVSVITAAYRTEGVLQHGDKTRLTWGRMPNEHFARFTTALHVSEEEEAIGLLRTAHADKSAALTREQIDAALARVEAAARARGDKLDFSEGHGRLQRDMAYSLGEGGRVAVGIGVAGSGKTTLLAPLVDAWHQRGAETYGVTVAWRQSHALADAGVGRSRGRIKKHFEADTDDLKAAGISNENALALTGFLYRAKQGMLKLDSNTVVIVDELSQVGTRQVLDLARLQKQHGFQIVGLGDPLQCGAIEAGNTVRLLQKALGEGAVPELVDTIRQATERDQETAGMFREGRAAEALARKEEDGTLVIEPGNYKQAVTRAVDLLMERRAYAASTGDARYTIGLSVPSNADVMAVGSEVRRRRQLAGDVGPDLVSIEAMGQKDSGTYQLALSTGDRLRLFNRVRDGHGAFGDNGSVVEVVEVYPTHGLTLRNDRGRESTFPWEKFRDPDTGIVRLAYGDALTIDARQGDTVREHITVMPNGSQAVNGLKAYTAESRHRIRSWIVTSEGEELLEIVSRRPLGDPRNITDTAQEKRAAVIANIARNLSRQDEKQLATDMVESARGVRSGEVDARQAAWHRTEARESKPNRAQRRAAEKASRKRAQTVAPSAAPSPKPEPQPPSAESSSAESPPAETRSPNPTPQRQERPQMSPAEMQSEFADALKSIGLVLEGAAVMDGQKHQVKAIGGKQGKARANSGVYTGYSSGFGVGFNNRTGEKIEYRPSGGVSSVSPEERAARAEADRAARQAQQEAQRQKEVSTADAAQRIWDGARLARADHPYLVAKDIDPDGLRQAVKGQTAPFGGKEVPIGGRLLVPLRDVDGKLWNLQLIDGNGRKLFLEGRKKGLFFVAGQLVDGQPKQIVEGVATAKSAYKLSLLTSVAAIDTSNLASVGADLRAKFPNDALIYVTDNDHHLPRRDPPMPNAGVKYGEQAAEANRGVAVTPQFPAGDKGTDINDIWVGKGFAAARTALEQAYEAKGVRELLPPAPPPPPKRDAREVAWSKAKPQRTTRSTPHRQVPREDQRPTHKPGV